MSSLPGSCGNSKRQSRGRGETTSLIPEFMKNKFKQKDSLPNIATTEQKEEESKEGEEAGGAVRIQKRKDHSNYSSRGRSVSTFSIMEGSNIVQSSNFPVARKTPQFGIPPTLLMKNTGHQIPLIVISCIELLDQDIRKEGMFRIPGRNTDILEMKISFEQGSGLGDGEPDSLAVAGLLALFFRELPEPLLTYDLYMKWINITKYEDTKFSKRCRKMATKLPSANYNLLKYFICFLSRVSENSGANRMGAKNLGLIFGASLINPLDDSQYDLTNIKSQCTLIENMITHAAYIFEGATESVKFSRSTKQVATIPAGAPKPVEKKKNFLVRAQLSTSNAFSKKQKKITVSQSHASLSSQTISKTKLH